MYSKKQTLALLLALVMVFSVIPAGAVGNLRLPSFGGETKETPQQETTSALPAQAAASSLSTASADEGISLLSDEDYTTIPTTSTTVYQECIDETITAGTYIIYSQVGARNLHASTNYTNQCGNPSPSDGYQTTGSCGNSHLWKIAKDSDGHFTIMSVSLNLYITGTVANSKQLALGSESDALHFTFDYTASEEQNGANHDGYHFKTTDGKYLYWDMDQQGWALSDTSKVVSLYKETPLTPYIYSDGAPAGGTVPGSNGTDYITPFPSGLAGSTYFRIPAMTTLRHQSDSGKNGRVLAAIDARWNHTMDGCSLDTISAYSDDDGKNWHYQFINYFDDSTNAKDLKAASMIDPVIVEGLDGTIYVMVDIYPGGIAINTAPVQPDIASGYIAINASGSADANGTKRLVLYTETNSGTSGGSSNQTDDSWKYYVGDFDSNGYAPVYAKGDATTVKYYIDTYYRLYTAAKEKMYCQRLGNDLQYVQMNVFYFNSVLHVRNATYLAIFTSTDGGATWSAPHIINDEVKTDDQKFFGVGPGAGTCLNDGTIVLPTYTHSTERASFIYSSDNGKTWHRANDATTDHSSESFLIQLNETTLRHFYRDNRSGGAAIRYTDHIWNGSEWVAQSPVTTEAVRRHGTQISGIKYSKLIDGKTAIIVSAPGNIDARQQGKLFTFLLNDDLTMDLAYTMEVNGESDPYAYSSITELENGSIALLYECTSNAAATAYKVYSIADVTGEDAVIGSRAVDLSVYQTYNQLINWVNPTSDWRATTATAIAGVNSAVATVKLTQDSDKNWYLTYVGIAAGTTSFTLDGYTYTITVTSDGVASTTKDIAVQAGKTVTETVKNSSSTLTVETNTNPDAATAAVSTAQDTKTINGGQGYQQTGASVWASSSTPLAKLLYRFDKQGDDTWYISNSNMGQTVYLNPGIGGGVVQQTSPQEVHVVTSQSDSTEFGIYELYGTTQRYIYFYRAGKDGHYRFDRNGGWHNYVSLQLYRPAAAGEASSAEVPGFVRVTSLADVTDGGEYLIVFPNSTADTYFAVYPTTSGTNYQHLLKIDTSLAKVDTDLPLSTYTHTITFTGHAAGDTIIRAGGVVYNVTVSPADATVGTISISGDLSKNYDGTAVDPSALTVTKNNAGGVVTFQFFDNAECVGALESAPVKAGTYYVRATMAADATYTMAQSNVLSFTIKAMSATISDVKQNGELLYTAKPAEAAAKLTYSNPDALDGALSFAEGTSFTPGKKDYTWVFTPTDTNYATATGTVTLTLGTPDYRPAGGTTQGQPFASGTGGSTYFRIPSLLTLKYQKDSSKNGRVLAAIDARWNITSDGCGLDTIVSYSDDNGENWSYLFPNYFEDSNGYQSRATAIIDPVMTEGTDGTIYMMVDIYPGGIAINTAPVQPDAASGYLEVNGKQRMVLYTMTNDGTNKGKSNHTDENWAYYIGDFSGGYAPVYAKNTTSDAKYYVDEWYYLYDANKDPMYCQRLGSNEYVKQNVFFYNADLHVRNATYLAVVTSTDGGESWSAPHFINDEVKTDDQIFYGVGPGAGLTITTGSLKGMVILPAYTYSNQISSFVYSRDGGKTWARSEDATSSEWSSESCLVQIDDTTVRQFYRSSASILKYVDHTWNGSKWVAGEPVSTAAAKSGSNGCQLSAIRYSKKIDGKTAYIVSTPATYNRVNGTLYVFLLNADKTMDLAYSYEINNTSTSYAYSSLAELSNGDVAVLYETTNTKIVYDTFSIADVAEGGLVEGGSLDLTVEECIPYAKEYGFTVSKAELEAVKTNAYVSVTATALTSGGVKLSILGKKVGTTSVTLGGCTFNITVTTLDSAKVTSVSLMQGQTTVLHPTTETMTASPDSAIATATLKPHFSVTGAQGGLGTTNDYNSSYAPLSNMLYQFNGNLQDGFEISHICEDGSRMYFYPGAASVYNPNTATKPASNVTVTDKGDGAFTMKNSDGNYLWLYEGGYCWYTSNSAYGFTLYRPIKSGETSSTEIPGYIAVSKIEDGEYYLITGKNKTSGVIYVVNPDSADWRNAISRVATEKSSVTATVPLGDATYDLTITGVANGETYLTVGQQVYRITVSDRIGISSETTGGAGKVRDITVLGTFTGKEYLVVQITEGSGSSARVSVMMLPLNGENPKNTISYKSSAKVDAMLTDGMPNLTGSGNAGASILASASSN